MTTKKTVTTTVKPAAKKSLTENGNAVEKKTLPKKATTAAKKILTEEILPHATEKITSGKKNRNRLAAMLPDENLIIAPEKTVAKKTKDKVVRDSFTMPQSDYQKIALLKETCLKSGLSVKKSELLRAGLNTLYEMDISQLKLALSGLEKIKTGRPKED